MEKLESIIFGLKAEVERLQDEKADLLKLCEKANDEMDKMRDEKDKQLLAQKAEIERLTERCKGNSEQYELGFKCAEEMFNSRTDYCIHIESQNRELQKQVDELKDERENMQAEILRFEDMKFTQEHCDLYSENETLKQWLKRLNADIEYEKNWGKIQTKQAEKDTAQEIYTQVLEWLPVGEDYSVFIHNIETWLKEKYGVEVE